MKRIEKWSLRYALFKRYVYLFFRLYYRHFSIQGLENIPKNKPIILAPNHQNALMDALTIVFSLSGQPVFLSRADIFKSKIAAYFLTILKLMPLYRIRDGKESLANNQDTFDSSIGVLESKKILCLFPEGAHIGLKSMLPHKKAIPRIAFLAGEKTNFELDIQVIPVGLYYSHYYKFRSDLVVQYGKPIPMKDYFEIYKNEGELKATQVLKDRIYDELSKICVNVPDKEYYDIYEQGFEIYRRKVCKQLELKASPINIVKAEQFITQKLKDYLDENLSEKDELLGAASAYKKMKVKLGIKEESIIKGGIKWVEIAFTVFLVMISLPFTLIGTILHGWIFRLTNYSSRKKIKDPQFYSTFSLSISFVAFSIWFAILIVIFSFILNNWLFSILLVLASIPTGIIAWEIIQIILRINNRLKYNRLKNKGNREFKILLENRSFLTSRFDKILI